MAEAGFIEQAFGDDGDEAQADAAASALDPTAAAFAAREAERDPKLAASMADYFQRQSRLSDLQLDHLHEQRRLNLEHLRARRWREGLQLTFQLFAALVTVILAAGVGLLLWDAATSRAVVVNAFKSPPPLAQRGLSGEVVGTGVLDALQKLQDATRGPSKGLTTRGAWAGDVKIEVPETGVSIGEVSRLLHERLGHDLHIDGDVVQRPDGGLALTIRGEGVPAKTFTGPVEDMDKLTTQSSEYLYGRAQPWEYAVFLTNTGRGADAVAFLPGAMSRATTDDERADLANVWGNAYSTLHRDAEGLRYHLLSKTYAKPFSGAWWKAWGNSLNDHQSDPAAEEEMWKAASAFVRAMEAAPADHKPEARFEQNPAAVTFDGPLLIHASLDESSRNGGRGANIALAAPLLASAYDFNHDIDAADRLFAAIDPDDPLSEQLQALAWGERALLHGDLARTIQLLERARALGRRMGFADTSTADYCWLGLAYARSARPADAKALFAATGSWSLCYAVQGQVAAEAGDIEGARRLWAEGVVHAPSVPGVYLMRGRWERDHANFVAAGADLAKAAQQAPHWADPWKDWGDLLARQGRWKDALAKYDAGLKVAPKWAELTAARAAAAAKT